MRQNINLSPLQYGWKPLLSALAMLLAGLALTAYSVHLTRQGIRDKAQTEFNQYADRIETSILNQFEHPLIGIKGAIGAKASTEVASTFKRANFRAYVATHDLATEFPGMRGFAYVERIQRSQLSGFEAAQKTDEAPDFTVKTKGDAPDLYVVKFIEPLAGNREALGVDLAVEPVRREAIAQAINTGQPSLSGSIALAQAGNKGPGFLYLVPVFPDGTTPDTAQDRRTQLTGFFAAPLVAGELLSGFFQVTHGDIDFELFDGVKVSPQTLVFSSQKTLAHDTAVINPTDFKTERIFHNARSLVVGGRLLTLQTGSSAIFEAEMDSTTPRWVVAGGATLSLMLAAIAWLLLVSRSRAETLAGAMTRDLDHLVDAQKSANEQLSKAMREAQALMEAINQHSMVSITDPAGTITYVNDTFISVSGYSLKELVGSTHRIVKSDKQADEFWAAMWKTISAGQVWRDVICNRAKNGALFWVDTLISPFFDDQGIEKYVAIRTDVTATKTAQQTLAAERERLNNILMGTRTGTWEWNVQTDALVVNARWADIIGYELQELNPVSVATWNAHCHPDDLIKAEALIAQHIEGGLGYYECEIRMRHREGHWVWIQDRGKISSWTAEGKPEWMSGTHMDISEQKLAEENLRRNVTVMQSILDNIPVGLSAFDSALHLIAKNRQFQTVLDLPDTLFSASATTFESIIRFNADRGEYGEGQHDQTVQSIVERARHPEPHQFERVRPNGMTLEVRGAPIPGGGFVTTYIDISQRKQAEAEIARTSAMLQSVLNAASEVAVITTGLDRIITLFNTGAERMLGYTAAEIVGIHNTALFFDAQELQDRSHAMSVELGHTVPASEVVIAESTFGKKMEWTYLRKDGSRLVVALVITPLTDAHGVRTGYLGISHDISTEKEYENGLHTAMQEAETATVAKSQFLANMSHEIRTPMNAILGMLKLLHHTDLSPRQLDYASKAEGAAKSLLGLLNDILDFSKMDAGKMTLDLQPFQVDRLMRELSVILSANVGKKPVEVLFDIDPAARKTLMGDSMRLRQVLINLSGNAIKFTMQGEVVIQIKVLAQTGADTTLRFSVRDSGIGIAPENQQHIFDGFSQAEASTTRRYGGTGLGLSISRRLVALMGGELALDSVLGQGSTFYFTLTLATVDPLPDVLDMAPARPLTNMNVLVVDDNPVARMAITAMAQSWGWQVDTAASGAEALDRVEARTQAAQPPYQAMFVDWQMPGMDGWETILRLRKTSSAADAPIIVMVTAHGREMLLQRTAQEQARLNGFLVKPITASMLFDAVAEAHASRRNPLPAPKAKAEKLHRLAGMRLLVVEDNLINQQVAKELLGNEGALIEIAANGQLGVEAVARAHPQFDAVLMDLQMPIMDGYEATRVIRQTLGLTQLPIIAMTANAMASDRADCLAVGMNEHVGKPFDLPHLIKLLRSLTKATPIEKPPQAIPLTGARVPGPLDVDEALERLGGNTALYANIVTSFLDQITALPEQLEVLLQGGDQVGATRLLHTLKGLSGTVGASHLAAVAKEAEESIKNADKAFSYDRLHAHFRAAVASTIERMGPIARQFAQPATGHPITTQAMTLDRARLLADIQKLLELLKSSDMRAIDAHAQLRPMLARSAPDELKLLDAAMTAFDFPKGVVQCQALTQKFSSSI